MLQPMNLDSNEKKGVPSCSQIMIYLPVTSRKKSRTIIIVVIIIIIIFSDKEICPTTREAVRGKWWIMSLPVRFKTTRSRRREPVLAFFREDAVRLHFYF